MRSRSPRRPALERPGKQSWTNEINSVAASWRTCSSCAAQYGSGPTAAKASSYWLNTGKAAARKAVPKASDVGQNSGTFGGRGAMVMKTEEPLFSLHLPGVDVGTKNKRSYGLGELGALADPCGLSPTYFIGPISPKYIPNLCEAYQDAIDVMNRSSPTSPDVGCDSGNVSETNDEDLQQDIQEIMGEMQSDDAHCTSNLH